MRIVAGSSLVSGEEPPSMGRHAAEGTDEALG